ncbi:MAG: 5'/3'-nucleotidase SurE [Bacteroidales bacterium]|nr:5'/3'-nucleotidase SurE [Bacteroidales bacterium]
MKPLLLLTNDDGISAPGMKALIDTVRPLGEVIVFAPDGNRSGKAHSMTSDVPLRVRLIERQPDFAAYACSGMPVDCIKLALNRFVPRRPDLVISGINYGSNASVCSLYSGTIGAAMEATQGGLTAVAYSLNLTGHKADFAPTLPFVKSMTEEVLRNGLPPHVMLNVNFPDTTQIKGVRVCRSSRAYWSDEAEERKDPFGHKYYWLIGHFHCDDLAEDTDQWALLNGFVSVVPCKPDYTDHGSINLIKDRF